MKKENLKPCPFCGAQVKTEPLYDICNTITAIYCTNEKDCGAMVTFVSNGGKKKTFTNWDKRNEL